MAATDPEPAGLLDRAKVDLVAKLLGKAGSTTYEPEAVALVERSYSLLAEVLSDFDTAVSSNPGSDGGGRRRERRLIRDRRKARRDGAGIWTRAVTADDGADRYRKIADSTDSTDPPGRPAGYHGTL